MKRIAAIAVIALGAGPAMAGGSACCGRGWESRDLLAAEALLDGICRGSTTTNEDMHGYACQARQAVIAALDRAGWCYGKDGQIGADMRWHICAKGYLHSSAANLHAYDWDEKTHALVSP